MSSLMVGVVPVVEMSAGSMLSSLISISESLCVCEGEVGLRE